MDIAEGVVKYLNLNLKLINCYGPYANREVFWEGIKRKGILNEDKLIFGGDLNFTTLSREFWGEHIRVDHLQLFFS
jgi:hypothetical protein